MATTHEPEEAIRSGIDAQTVALRLVAGTLVVAAASQLAGLLVPFFLAIVLAIALSPLADRLERLGLGRPAASVICLLAVVAAIAVTAGLLSAQAGSIVRDADEHIEGFSRLLARVSRSAGGDRMLESLG
jgi:predicted PurR-regulated permease PerM